MGLMESLTWVVVELQSHKPDMDAVRMMLDEAVKAAAKLGINHDVRLENLVRLVAVHGGY